MKLLKRFWTDFVRNYRWYYAAGLLCLVGTNLLTVAIPKFVENAIDALDTTDGSHDASRFAFAVRRFVDDCGGFSKSLLNKRADVHSKRLCRRLRES